jgi:hypothetical protein
LAQQPSAVSGIMTAIRNSVVGRLLMNK